MIQPVNALTPKVLFRGKTNGEFSESAVNRTKKRIALINAGGISLILGAATTAIARSNTSSWKHAGYFGVGAALISMMFLGPGFMYKSGINTTRATDKDVFSKERDVSKKFIAEDISSVAKTTTKTVVKNMPKV